MRYFVKSPNASVSVDIMTRVFSERAPATPPRRSKIETNIIIADLDEKHIAELKRSDVELYEDFQFDIVGGNKKDNNFNSWSPLPQTESMLSSGKSLDDVLQHIKAPDAWEITRGGGVTIAVIDTGTCDTLREFPSFKRSPIDINSIFKGRHWEDVKGHGSMCATIATASKSMGGVFDGVAPDATLLSARTSLYASDIYTIYDELISKKRSEEISGPLVISNSYGLYTCDSPNVLPQDHPYMSIVLTAISENIPVVFAAGNNHYNVLCENDPDSCETNTIWAVNSHERVLSVGTVNEDNSNQISGTIHANSSRGPGEWSGDFPKPDCVAPTYGRIVWGCNYQEMEWWGTSGACPQVAGLAALILSVNPRLTSAEVSEIIRTTSQPTGAPHNCVGHGVIDCLAAVEKAQLSS